MPRPLTSFRGRRSVGRGLACLLLLLAAWSGPARAQSLPSAPPDSLGIDAERLARAVDEADRLDPITSLIVARHGTIATEQYFDGMAADRRVNIKSASKSVLSALVGIALARGDLDSLDQPVLASFPRYDDVITDPRKDAITLRHLLMMTAGLETTSFYNYGTWVTSDDWVRAALAQPMVDVPGGRMIYSTGSSHLVSALLTAETGTSTLDYAMRHLFGPLGIDRPRWDRDPRGIYFGGNNLALRPRELLRFGQLYLDGGRYGGRQVLPAGWVEAATTAHVFRSYRGFHYGYFWWIHRFGGYRTVFAWGYGGQYLFLVPALDLAVVVTSSLTNRPDDRGHNGRIYRLLERYILPAVEPPPPSKVPPAALR